MRQLYRAGDPGDGGRLTDTELVERFARRGDEAAFEVLLWRHGPTVLGVCRRLLRREQDVEDAFQATFLVLLRKAGSIGNREAVAGWLYRVAYRIALEARTRVARRAARETAGVEDLPGRPVPEPDAGELRLVLDEEVNRLPARYRLPVVLCHFEGKSSTEAARQLGCAEATVRTRLARARQRLRGRLVRRGLTVAAALAAVELPGDLTAAVPGRLADTTVRAAARSAAADVSPSVAALVQGGLRSMFLSRLKAVLVLLAAGVASGGAGVLAHRALAQRQADAHAPPAALAAAPRPQPPPAPRGPAAPFENDFGYSWLLAPFDVADNVAALARGDSTSSSIHWSGMSMVLHVHKRDGLVLTLSHAVPAEKPGLDYRVVAFDAARKRYPLYTATAGSSTRDGVRLYTGDYLLDPKALPADKVHDVGVEILTPQGRQAITARALGRAKAAGIEVLPPARVGGAYPFTLTAMDGKKLRSRDLRGKVVLIDCWSTTCLPCMEKMPKLKALYAKYHAAGFEVIGVNLDEDARKARKTCESRGLSWPQVFVPADEKTRELWYESAGLAGVPRLLLIDRQGILQADCRPDQLEEEVTRQMERPAGR
jgi:RNA polymerase sigma factor (sigma-70 family)